MIMLGFKIFRFPGVHPVFVECLSREVLSDPVPSSSNVGARTSDQVGWPSVGLTQFPRSDSRWSLGVAGKWRGQLVQS